MYIRNNLRKTQPPLPRSIEEVINNLEIPKMNFFFINDDSKNIVVFSCLSNNRYLCNNEKIYLDGTFSCCTKYFLQMFTIHVLNNGHYIPLAFCLLSDKQQDTVMGHTLYT